MRAAVTDQDGRSVRIQQLDLRAADGGEGVAVVAAAINPVDAAIAGGKLPFRRLQSGGVLGFDGVAERGDGTRVYFSAPRQPWGSFAERVDLEGAETVDVPAGVDPVAAAAVGVPGIAAYLALTSAGGFEKGHRVLVLGGTGGVGRVAVQTALALGAQTGVASGRDDEGVAAIEELGAQAARSDRLDEALQELAGDGFDVVVDTIWGDSAAVALRHMRTGGRLAQVGNSAAATATISAPDFRNHAVTIVGHSNFLSTAEQRADAYEHVVELVRQGRVNASVRTVPLDDLPAQWDAMASGSGGAKPVVVP